jgi:hypothetical protein
MSDVSRPLPAEKAASLDDVLTELDARLEQVIQLCEQFVEQRLSAR